MLLSSILVEKFKKIRTGLKLNSLNQILVYLNEIHVVDKDLSSRKWLLLLKCLGNVCMLFMDGLWQSLR
jgi:hypothetical protein